MIGRVLCWLGLHRYRPELTVTTTALRAGPYLPTRSVTRICSRPRCEHTVTLTHYAPDRPLVDFHCDPPAVP